MEEKEKRNKRGKKRERNKGSNRYYQRNDILVLEVNYSEQIKLSFLSEYIQVYFDKQRGKQFPFLRIFIL